MQRDIDRTLARPRQQPLQEQRQQQHHGADSEFEYQRNIQRKAFDAFSAVLTLLTVCVVVVSLNLFRTLADLLMYSF